MKISGLICEYNPLHNGHLYHLQKMREHGADAIVAIMSGNFVQRGDVAVLDKFTRAKLAVYSGVDLVIELPAAHALAPAEAFAMGGVSLLHALGNVSELPAVKNAFAGIRVGVAVLMINSVIKLAKAAIVDWKAVLIFLAVFGGAVFTPVSPMIYIVAAGVAGILLKTWEVKAK